MLEAAWYRKTVSHQKKRTNNFDGCLRLFRPARDLVVSGGFLSKSAYRFREALHLTPKFPKEIPAFSHIVAARVTR